MRREGSRRLEPPSAAVVHGPDQASLRRGGHGAAAPCVPDGKALGDPDVEPRAAMANAVAKKELAAAEDAAE